MRYLRLYLNFVRFSFSRALEFRVDFFFRVVMDCMFYAVNLIFFRLLFDHIEGLGDLGLDEVYIFVAGYLFTDAVQMTVFSNNMWFLPFLINKGDLDYHLVRPVSSLFFVSLRDFAANSFLNLLIASGILAWALARYPGDLGAVNIGCFVLLLLTGTVLHWNLYMLFIIPVFWLHASEGLRQLYWSLQTFGERPHKIFRGWTGRVLMSILPLALFVSYPTYLLVEGFHWEYLWPILVVSPGLFGVTLFAWSRGLRAYSSASS